MDAQRAADAFGAFAVEAAVFTPCAGWVFAKPCGVFRRGDVSCAVCRFFKSRLNLVPAENKVNLFMAENGRGNTVSRSVNIDKLARFRGAVDRSQIDRRKSGFFPRSGVLLPVPINGVIF